MALYLKPTLVLESFKRLSSRNNEGKKSLERTSALMYFLSFDAAVKNIGYFPIDLNPNSFEGKSGRDIVQLEFVKLVHLKQSNDMQVRQVLILGKIDTGGTLPEKRISSNFFTVPLKKASENAKEYVYPNRPAPVLKMGFSATGKKWGVDYHDQWRDNLPKLLSDVKSNTAFSDLAIFVLRNEKLPDGFQGLRKTLFESIKSKFSISLADYWCNQMEAESVFFKHGNNPFQDYYEESLPEENVSGLTRSLYRDKLNSLDREALLERVNYLESVLDREKIEYRDIN